MITTTVEVTAEDMKWGNLLRNHHDAPRTCPVALASRRTWPKASVGKFELYTNDRDKSMRPLSLRVRKFIRLFDQRESVEPFTFEV